MMAERGYIKWRCMNMTENLSPAYLLKAVSSEFSSGIWGLIHFVVPGTDEAVTAVIVMFLSPLVSPVHKHQAKKSGVRE
jgi:hypothetical protein